MTAAELTKLVGMQATIVERGLTIAVVIKAARTVYGRDELLVTPYTDLRVSGTEPNQAWVSVDRVKVRKGKGQ